MSSSWNPAEISDKLDAHIPIQSLQKRAGFGDDTTPIYYVPRNYAISTANEIFGPENWWLEEKSVKVLLETKETINNGDNGDNEEEEYLVIVSVCLRVQLKSGAYHEDIAIGEGRSTEKFYAESNARRMAVYSGTKRVLKMFGRALGNGLSEKHLRDMYARVEQMYMH